MQPPGQMKCVNDLFLFSGRSGVVLDPSNDFINFLLRFRLTGKVQKTGK